MNIDKEYEIERIDTLRGTVRAHMQNDIFTMRMLCTLQNKEISTLFDLLDNYRRTLSSELNKEQKPNRMIDVDELRKELGFAVTCDNCKQDACDTCYSFKDFCIKFDDAVDTILEKHKGDYDALSEVRT